MYADAVLRYTFIAAGVLLALMITVFKLFIQKKKRTEKTVLYTHILIWVFVLYIASAFLLALFAPKTANKAAAVFFAVSPFIIGRFASYKYETVFSIIQIFCALLSAAYFLFQTL